VCSTGWHGLGCHVAVMFSTQVAERTICVQPAALRTRSQALYRLRPDSRQHLTGMTDDMCRCGGNAGVAA